jgi:dTDP-glucose 4,6-dehydratase
VEENRLKLLVAGGAGFIGSNFIRRMLARVPELSIVNLDALTYAGRRENLQDLESSDRYTFVHGDIRDEKLVSDLMSKVDGVINFAAESHVDRSIEDPDAFLSTNIGGVRILLDAVREQLNGGRRLRFLQISTDEVYGDLGFTDERFTETSPIEPSSPYSASKASADLMVMAWRRTFGIEAVITRCSNNYGPWQFPEKLIPLMIWKAWHQESLPVYGKGENVRDWIFVDDHVDAIWAVFTKAEDGSIYNVGGNNEWTNISIVKRLLHEMDRPESLISFVEDRLGHDLRYAIDASKIERDLGFVPSMAFGDGLAQTIAWYRSNESWLEAVRSSV